MEKSTGLLGRVVNNLPVCLLVLLFSDSFDSNAQSLMGLKQSKLFLKNKVSIDSLTRLIHLKTKVRVSFNSVKVNGDQTVFFSEGVYSVYEVLDKITSQTRLGWQLYKTYIIYQVRPKLVEKRISPPGKNKRINRMAVDADKSIQPKRAFRLYPHNPAPPPLDSGRFSAAALVKKIIPSTVLKPSLLMDTPDLSNTEQVAAAGLKFRRYLSAGLIVNQLPAAQLLIQGGFNKIHLIALAGSNLRSIEWGGGLGSFIFERERSSVHLSTTLHFLQRTNSAEDTINSRVRLQTKGQQLSFAISWNKSLGQSGRWQFGAGITYNLLTTKFYLNKKSVQLHQLPRVFDRSFEERTLVNPLIIFSNNFNQQKEQFKLTWPGIFLKWSYRF
jgi:hypothetical protein